MIAANLATNIHKRDSIFIMSLNKHFDSTIYYKKKKTKNSAKIINKNKYQHDL